MTNTSSLKDLACQVVATLVKSILFLYTNTKQPRDPHEMAKCKLPKMDDWLWIRYTGSRVGVFSWASPPYALPRAILLQLISLLSFVVILSLVWSLPQYGTDSGSGAVGDRKKILSTSSDGSGGLDEDDSEGPGDGPDLATASWSQVE